MTFMDTFALRALVTLQKAALTTQGLVASRRRGIQPGVQRLLDLACAREELRWISPEQLAG